MSIGERLTNLWQYRRVTPRQVTLFLVSVAVLVTVVFFNQDIVNLFRWLRGSAAGEPNPFGNLAWADVPASNFGRSNAKLIDVTDPAGNRYLYLIGGIETKTVDGNKRLSLIKSVERIPLNQTTGAIDAGSVWEKNDTNGTWGQMYAGHAEFGVVQSTDKRYLYVISGDIHIPNPLDFVNYSPLLFSTIEQLDLTNINLGWQPIALLTGVNFYPEVIQFNGRLHIIGGVYGNPFSAGYSWSTGGQDPYEIKDPLLLTDNDTNPVDLWKWDDKYEDLPVIGDLPVALPDSGIGADIDTGSGGPEVDPGGLSIGIGGMGGTGMVMADDGVHIQQVGGHAQNLSDTLTRGLISGEFVTTVSEHYIINPVTLAIDFKGELGKKSGVPITTSGNDYTGELSEIWELGKVMHIAHLRMWLDDVSTSPLGGFSVFTLYPAPQGRYGHKVFINNNTLYVVGGASWAAPIEKIYRPPVGNMFFINIYSFWVIDDDTHPFSKGDNFDRTILGFLRDDYYKYLGNITYQWDNVAEVWKGTNTVSNTSPLPSDYAFQSGSPLQGSGRAFFAWAELHPTETTTEFLAIGGLENNLTPDSDADNNWGLPLGVRATAASWPSVNYGLSVWETYRVEKFAGSSWETRAPLPNIGNDIIGVYGATAVGGGTGAIVFGGQTELIVDPEQPFFNDHVPAYERTVNTSGFGYLDSGGDGDTGTGTWWPMQNIQYARAYPATLDVRTATIGGGETIYIYKANGSTVGDGDGLPNNTSQVEALGPIQYGGAGVVDWSKSFIEVEPAPGNPAGYYNWPGTSETTLEILADRHDYALVTVNLMDYYGNPATSAGLDQVPGGLAVSLYTEYASGLSRSPKPAIKKNIKGDPTSTPDWIRIKGQPTSSTGGLLSPEWDNQFVLVDMGGANGGEDGNPDTTAGQVQFYISSSHDTFDTDGITPSPIEALAYILDTNETAFSVLADGALNTLPHKNELIFTYHGVPSLKSTVTATSPVKADGVAESTVTVTLIDTYDNPVPSLNTKVESNRNLDTDQEGHLIIHDNIVPPTKNANDQGIAIYKVSSPLIGRADLQGYYAPPVAVPDDLSELPNWIGYKTANVLFTNQGQIISLFPESAKQGQIIKDPTPMVAVGDLVQWDASKTTVMFLPSEGISFQYQQGNSGWDDIEKLMLYADKSVTNFRAMVDPSLANAQLYLKITEGGGSFYTAGYPDNITVNVTSSYAEFPYITSETPGILKIEVRLNNASGNKLGELWLPMAKSENSLVSIAIDASKHSVAVNEAIEVTAQLKNIHGTAYLGQTFTFTKDDGTSGYFTPANGQVTDTDDDGKVVIQYTRTGTGGGTVHIFATATYETELASDRVAIRKLVDASANQTITYDSTGLDVQTEDASRLSLTFGGTTGVTVGSAAPVGIWTFLVSTDLGLTTPAEETTTFLVEPAGPTAPTILTLDPAEGLRGHGYDIEIDAVNTGFEWNIPGSNSVVTFTPVNGGDPVTTPIVASSTNSFTHLTVRWDIAANAKVGNWNVKVTTGNQVAEMPFNHDFKVTTESGYFLDVVAVPSSIARDGSATSTITATAGFVELTGDITPLDGDPITFDKGTAGGSLTPDGTTTKADGSQTCVYQTDGPEDATAETNIQVSVVDTAQTLLGTVKIIRTGMNPNDIDVTKSWISATSPVPASGDPLDASLVTVTVRNGLSQPLSGIVVTLSTNHSEDTILTTHLNPQPTDTDGRAIFEVMSMMPVHTSTITATFGNGLQKQVNVLFEDPTLLSRRFFALTVPFQARDYDNQVWTVIKHNGAEKNMDDEYKKNTRTATNPDLLTDLEGIRFYLYNGTNDSYTVWVKGKNHLAAAKTTVKTSDAVSGVISINFSTIITHGLKVGDIAIASGGTQIKPGYHDNTIGSVDSKAVYDRFYGSYLDLPDLDFNQSVNLLDFTYTLANWGAGAPLP
ncbi:MAG: hypothetical protein WC805_02935 [Patescibacteria group bacterium]|jgi:hypothetical protein